MLVCLAIGVSVASAGMKTELSDDSTTEEYVVADDYVFEIDETIAADQHYAVYVDKDSGDGVYGSFTVTSGNDIDFFICNDAEYDKWESGETASVYHLQEKVGEYSFTFRIPYSDTWYFVYSNEYSILTSKVVEGELCYDYTPPSIDMNIDSGATYSGIKEITAEINEATFDIGSVKLYIDDLLVDTEYDSSFSYDWNTEDYDDGTHSIEIVASDNVGNSDSLDKTVYTSNAASTGPSDDTTDDTTTDNDSDNSGGQTQGLLTDSSFLFIILFIVVIVGGAAGASQLGGKDEPDGDAAIKTVSTPESPPTTATQKSPSSEHQKTEDTEAIHSRETIRERYLVVCPYCGTKNEQGRNTCHKCGGVL